MKKIKCNVCKKKVSTNKELRKANILVSTYRDLWEQAEKRIEELKSELRGTKNDK